MNIIWVSSEGKKYCPNADQSSLGSISMPLQTLQDAMHKISFSNKTFWEVRVSPGFYSDPFIIPSNKIICIVGSSRATSLGDCTWKTAGKLSSIIIFRDLGLDKLKIEDDADSFAELAPIGFENCSVNEIIKTGKSKVDIGLAGIGAASSDFAGTLGGAGVVYGDIKADDCYILANNISFFSGKVIYCKNCKMQNCLFEQEIHSSGDNVTLISTQWLIKNLTITFTKGFGKLIMDSVSLNSFYKNNINLINGMVEVL